MPFDDRCIAERTLRPARLLAREMDPDAVGIRGAVQLVRGGASAPTTRGCPLLWLGPAAAPFAAPGYTPPVPVPWHEFRQGLEVRASVTLDVDPANPETGTTHPVGTAPNDSTP